MSKWILALVAIIFCMPHASNGYKILVVSPIPSSSHAILGDGITNTLAKAGHEITYITAKPPSKPEPRVTYVDISEKIRALGLEDIPIKLNEILDKTSGVDSLSMFTFILHYEEIIVSNENIQKLLSDTTQNFDLIIVEWMLTGTYAGFSGVFNCPYIWFSTVEPHWMVLKLIDEIPNPAYNADISSNSVPPFSFGQRVLELFLQVFGTLLQKFYISKSENNSYEKFFVPHIRARGLPVPTLESLIYNASLILSNSHVSLGVPIRLPPNLISIGGYHIDSAVKPLPQDLQKIMDDAKNGVIYFSMGSNLRSKHFPDEMKKDLLKMFGKLNQTILWKFEEELPNRPSNVHILKWAPQQSILAHKNCIIFITHGGYLSTTETIYFGVPTIGIPVFGDQHVNVDRSVRKGFARKVSLSYDLAKDLNIEIREMLSDQRYGIKAKELSKIYHHRAVHPSKELVHWVEHVVQTGGAPHLRHPALTMPWYQKMYLDLVVVIIVICLALKYIFKYVYELKMKSKKKKD